MEETQIDGYTLFLLEKTYYAPIQSTFNLICSGRRLADS